MHLEADYAVFTVDTAQFKQLRFGTNQAFCDDSHRRLMTPLRSETEGCVVMPMSVGRTCAAVIDGKLAVLRD
jgi:hypothetical protein